MKIRAGFVSNSSSSSFIIGVPKGTELTEKMIKSALDIDLPKGNILKPLADKMVSILCDHAQKTDANTLASDWGYNTVEEFLKGQKKSDEVKLIERGFDIYCGDVSSEEQGFESAMCDMDFDYESDTIVIKKEGGY